MPEPQTGTSTVVATDGDTCIRLGIGSHSVGTAPTRVKSFLQHRSDDDPVALLLEQSCR
jgi:hypothetical protein